MSNEHIFDEKGKTQAKSKKETAVPQKQAEANPQSATSLNSSTVAQMQQTVGNTAVQRLLAQRSGNGPAEIEDDTANAIQRKRGSGQTLDSGMAAKAGQTMGHDLSDVKVHTDAESNQLNEQLGAKAFTTGNDIFFREGAYDPGSSDGQRLLAHELTHVVQQGASAPTVQGKMMVNDPNDQYEAEADKVADTVMSQPTAVQRDPLSEDKDEENLQMQELTDEDKEEG